MIFRSNFIRLLAMGLLLLTPTLGEHVIAGEEDSQPSDSESDKEKDKKSKIKPYDDVITKEARSRSGLFMTHRVGDKLYYEIPVKSLETDLLWVTQIAETTAGNSYAGMPASNNVVRWEQRDDRILLRIVKYDIRAETDDPISEAVRASNLAPIIRVFDVVAYGKDKAPVIEVTTLYTKDVPEFGAANSLKAGAMDSGRTFIEEVKAFERNVEVRVLASFAAGRSTGSADNPPGQPSSPRSSGITAMIHHSMVKLPERPMKPRRHDSRVGFFNVGFLDYADDSEHQAETVRYITRWRLEKKDPEAEVSEPVKPIVFYVGREVPKKWQSYVKAGIEEWQPAFEAAGFKNAILGKYAPDPREDPDWDAEDARISTIRWLPSNIENAFGPHVHDPRTGEILEADVRMYHNVQKLVRDWYFVQASPNDERAQKLPLPDELMGELIQFVVTHEVGHSLGFPHNMKASSSYTIEQLRDPEWTRKNGTAPSIMDYARFNYVAQPGDGASLTPKVGPYDEFAVKWGYTQFAPDAKEKEELEKITKAQIEDPILRFGGPNPAVDSTQQTEDLGDDAVEATRLGLKNLERVAGYLVKATSESGKDYDQLSNMYDQLFRQWNREMGHVVNVVGGVKEINLFYGDAEQRFFAPNADSQREAMAFLLDHALKTPIKFVSPDIVLRITQEGVAERVLKAQNQVLFGILNSNRIKRLSEIAQLQGSEAFLPTELFQGLRLGLFQELQEAKPDIDLYRRNLQRSYIDFLAKTIDKPVNDSDLPALARAELLEIRALMAAQPGPQANRLTALHLGDLAARITSALDPQRQSD